ncbi:hypothetical protein C8J57DRAFT_1405327 [Mycena rebaudengoi]|nr:hypothetical protein C8J57DRAFT_1405327 [Mycena rebaudengoi]
MNGLPQELTDAIIDDLHDDQQALLQSSLVCHALWVPARQYHLFSCAQLQEETKLRFFLDILVAENCTFVELVTILRFTGGEWSDMALLDAAIPVHLSQLTLVVAVHIGFGTPSTPHFFAGILSRFPKLSHLELAYHPYESLNQVFALLRHCPTSISLRMPSFWHHADPGHNTQLCSIHLQLQKPNAPTLTLVTTLFATISSSRITRIIVAFHWAPDFDDPDATSAWSEQRPFKSLVGSPAPFQALINHIAEVVITLDM